MVTRVAVWGVCAHMRERVHELVPTHEACGGEVFTIGCSFPFRTGALREGLSSEEAEVEEGGDRGPLTPLSLTAGQAGPPPSLSLCHSWTVLELCACIGVR